MVRPNAIKLGWAAILAADVALAAWSVSDFDWTTVKPSETLNFTSCYDTHRCAKLQVPLDWLNPENEHSKGVTIAVIKRPAAVDAKDSSFGGTIITNPGGPGASGVGFLLGFGEKLQRKADGDKKYEILSFDPRGVGLTTPSADCHKDEFARGAWKLENRALNPIDSSHTVTLQKLARASSFGQLCDSNKSGSHIQHFISTSSVVRDMVKIIDDLAELRAETTRESEHLELRKEPKAARILYWGFSYGSVLGQYFASMFPGRVGRMILEGIVDIEDYSQARWEKDMQDTSAVLDHFWHTCYEGKDRCAIFDASDKSPKDVERRVRDFLATLDQAPVPFFKNGYITSITRQDAIGVIFQALYQPLQEFKGLAEVLAESMSGNYTQLFKRLALPTAKDSGPPSTFTWIHDAMLAIACGDGKSRANMSVTDVLQYVQKLKKDSPEFGADWSRHVWECRGWAARPKYRFMGPFTTPEADASLVEGKPAAPLFFITSRADPVTPRENAYVAAKSYPGSRVLLQTSFGHAVADSPSRCTSNYVREYLDKGVLPEEATVCEPDCTPFQPCEEEDIVPTNRERQMTAPGMLAIAPGWY